MVFNSLGMNAKAAWIIQESPSFIIAVTVVFSVGPGNIGRANLAVIGMFALHYFHRSVTFDVWTTYICVE